MEIIRKFKIGVFALTLIVMSTNLACNDDEADTSLNEFESVKLSNEDTNALLFMLEEEKLAGDT